MSCALKVWAKRSAIEALSATAARTTRGAAPISATPAINVLRRMACSLNRRCTFKKPAAARSPTQAPANSLRRRHLGVDVARHDHGDERRWNVLRPERSWNRILDRRKALQVGGDRLRVVRRQMGEVRPGHDREQLAAIRRHACGDGGDNLLGRPAAEARFLVRGQVAADENADAGDPESNLGARKRPGKVK